MQNLGIGSRVKHPRFGIGVVCGLKNNAYKISFGEQGVVDISTSYAELEIIEVMEDANAVTLDITQKLTDILEKWSDINEIVFIAEKFKRGTLLIQPADKALKPKEVPIEGFFHKIVMLRDRLRVLEQKINAHKGLQEDEKIEMQQYITRCYGTLTTFNVLFRDDRYYFVGEKGQKD